MKLLNLKRIVPFTVDDFHATVIESDFLLRFLRSRKAFDIAVGPWHAHRPSHADDNNERDSQRKTTCRMELPRLEQELSQTLKQARSVEVTVTQRASFDRTAMRLDLDEVPPP